jgi:hypothetical protein
VQAFENLRIKSEQGGPTQNFGLERLDVRVVVCLGQSHARLLRQGQRGHQSLFLWEELLDHIVQVGNQLLRIFVGLLLELNFWRLELVLVKDAANPDLRSFQLKLHSEVQIH